MALNVPGLVTMVVFYLVILGTGVWASMRAKKEEKRCSGSNLEIKLLAGRNINLVVGIFTLTATWVGGGFILGIAEATYNPTLGAVWALMPVPYVLTFFLGGFFFAKPMRQNKYVTMMDPFQTKYGNVMATVLMFPALVADVMWVARTLVSVGGTLAVILDLSYVYSIIISAVVAIIYTLLGGLYSVAYTDVIQLIFIFVSLWLCVPFLLTNPHSLDIAQTAYTAAFQAPWVGTVELNQAGKWVDDFMVLALGGLAYQAFYQRILSASSYTQAQVTCFASSAFCLVLGIPSVLVGAVAASTDWNSTAYGLPSPFERGQAGSVLPIALQFLTPPYVSVIGIGAVAAAVMSSMDSALLSSASLFSSNIYKNIIRKQASDREMQWVIRISVVATGVVGTALTFLESSVLVFWLVGVDMSYTILFPQLVCVLFCEVSNSYGASVGFVTGIVMRVLSGEALIGLPPVIRFPGCRLNAEGKMTQFFPYRTTIMVMSLVSILLVSWMTSIVFSKGLLSDKWDVFKIKQKLKPEATDETSIEPNEERDQTSDPEEEREQTNDPEEEREQTNDPEEKREQTNDPEEERDQTNDPEEERDQTNDPEEERDQTNDPEEERDQTNDPEEKREQTNDPEEKREQTNDPEEERDQTNDPEEKREQTNDPEEKREQTNDPEEKREQTNDPEEERDQTNDPEEKREQTNDPEEERDQTNDPEEERDQTNDPEEERDQTNDPERREETYRNPNSDRNEVREELLCPVSC